VRIKCIGFVQWFLIRSAAADGAVLIQADRVEDGLAATWKHFRDAQGPEMSASGWNGGKPIDSSCLHRTRLVGKDAPRPKHGKVDR
jgi:hypothetical protein